MRTAITIEQMQKVMTPGYKPARDSVALIFDGLLDNFERYIFEETLFEGAKSKSGKDIYDHAKKEVAYLASITSWECTREEKGAIAAIGLAASVTAHLILSVTGKRQARKAYLDKAIVYTPQHTVDFKELMHTHGIVHKKLFGTIQLVNRQS